MAAGGSTWAAMREIASQLAGGPFCAWCGVPSLATIDHVQARTAGGGHGFDNLRVCCPYCNSRKGNRPLEQFLSEEGFKLDKPADLPVVTREMLVREFGWDHASGEVSTASSNSKLLVEAGEVFCLVRARKQDEWIRVRLGPIDRRAVTQAAWDFLKRHHTPATPQRKKPTKQMMAKSAAKKKRRST